MMFENYKNKKGSVGMILAIGLGLLLMIDLVFFSFFIYKDVNTQVVGEFNNISQQLNYSETTTLGTQQIYDDLTNIDYKLDILVLLIFTTYSLGSLGISWISPNLPKWNVWSLLTIGNLFFMLMYSVIADIRNFFYNDVLVYLYGNDVLTQTGFIYQWFSNNYAWYLVTLMVACVVLNQFTNKPSLDDYGETEYIE